MKEKEIPYACPSCNADLHQRASVFAWRRLPHRLVGHVIPGKGDGVIFMADVAPDDLPLELECADCGQEIPERVEEVRLDPECRIGETPQDETETQP